MREPKEEVTPARITLQFREAANMTYELDCEGVALVLRIFFPTDTGAGAWRIVAQASTSPDSPSTASTAASKLEALRALARSCHDGGGLAAFARIDWNAVERAMANVRAV
jgi:hypothetical protein